MSSKKTNLSETELLTLPISRHSDAHKTRKLKAVGLSLEKIGKPPLQILEELGEMKEDEDFININKYEQILIEAFDDANLINKKKELDKEEKDIIDRKKRYTNNNEDSYTFGPRSEIGKKIVEFNKKKTAFENDLNNTVIQKLDIGEGRRKRKRKRKKTHKKFKKIHKKSKKKKHKTKKK